MEQALEDLGAHHDEVGQTILAAAEGADAPLLHGCNDELTVSRSDHGICRFLLVTPPAVYVPGGVRVPSPYMHPFRAQSARQANCWCLQLHYVRVPVS